MGRILITGGAGFIGRHVLERLRATGAPLRVVVRNDRGVEQLAALGHQPGRGLEVVQADLTRRAEIPKVLEGCDRVVHLAGRVSSRQQDRKAIYLDNVTTASHLLEAAQLAGIRRFVLVSHVLAAGGGHGPIPVTEEISFRLSRFPSDFVQARRVVELEALRAAARGLPVILPTLAFCLGPGDVHRSMEFLLGTMPAGLELRPAGGVSVIDVRDAATGIVAALERGEPGTRYFLSGTDITFEGLFQRIARGLEAVGQRSGARAKTLSRGLAMLPTGPWLATVGGVIERLSREPIFDRTRGALFGQSWYYDDRRARLELGHQSRPLDETVRDLVGWIQARELLTPGNLAA